MNIALLVCVVDKQHYKMNSERLTAHVTMAHYINGVCCDRTKSFLDFLRENGATVDGIASFTN